MSAGTGVVSCTAFAVLHLSHELNRRRSPLINLTVRLCTSDGNFIRPVASLGPAKDPRVGPQTTGAGISSY